METSVLTSDFFWDNVKKLLKEQGKTQIGMERDLKFSKDSLRQWIFKKRYPDPKETYLIAKYLNTSVEFLITGAESENPDRAPDVIRAVEETLKQFK